MTFEELCKQGDAADALLAQKDYVQAQSAYEDILDAAIESGVLDSFIVSKIALGLLLSLLGQKRDGAAHELWTKDIEDGPMGMGIWGLENGQTSTHDLIVYFLASSYLHSLSTDADGALTGVNDLMGRVSGYAQEEDESMLPLVVHNWNLHLAEIFEGGDIPDAASAGLRSLEGSLEAQVQSDGSDSGFSGVTFPPVSPWVIDWNGPDDEVTEFSPDGTVRRVKAGEEAGRKPKKRGFFSRLFGWD